MSPAIRETSAAPARTSNSARRTAAVGPCWRRAAALPRLAWPTPKHAGSALKVTPNVSATRSRPAMTRASSKRPRLAPVRLPAAPAANAASAIPPRLSAAARARRARSRAAPPGLGRQRPIAPETRRSAATIWASNAAARKTLAAAATARCPKYARGEPGSRRAHAPARSTTVCPRPVNVSIACPRRPSAWAASPTSAATRVRSSA